jgi:hypothetical protein
MLFWPISGVGFERCNNAKRRQIRVEAVLQSERLGTAIPAADPAKGDIVVMENLPAHMAGIADANAGADSKVLFLPPNHRT